jgi:uncharacterized protein (DUF488 family)
MNIALVQSPTVLVCMEANPNLCHRSRLADALELITGFPIIHMRANDDR